MTPADLWAFVKAFPQLVNVIQNLQQTINTLNLEIKNKNLEEFKGEIRTELDGILLAKNDEARRAGIVALSKRLNK